MVLMLFNNRLTGTLPKELGKYSPGLYNVQVDNNELTGGIPEGLCTGGQLLTLAASNNRLNGSMPLSLARCASLEYLILDSNQLSGDIPTDLGYGTPLLKQLKLANNKLSGRIC
jgi:Leucine-rich repeat (LRR) protein